MFTFREFLLAEAKSEDVTKTDKSEIQDNVTKKPVVEDKSDIDSILSQIAQSQSSKKA